MDVIDRQIIQTLLRFDPNFFDHLSEIPSSVTELDAEKFYQAIVVLLWACKPSLKKEIPSKLLPRNMSAKFRCATNVVNAVKSVGVRDTIDYHVLLYGRSKELRNVLIGLVEKLPKDSPIVFKSEDLLTDLIRSALRVDQGKSDEYGWCFAGRGRSWGKTERMNFMGFYGDVSAALRYDDFRYCPNALICSILENNASSEVLPPKPRKKAATNTKQETHELSEEIVKKNKVLNKLMGEITTQIAFVDRQKASEAKMQSDEAERLSILRSKKLLESKIDERLKKLLENPDAVIKLENYTSSSDERMEHLQNLWLKAKAEKDDEVNAARLATSTLSANKLSHDHKISWDNVNLTECELAERRKNLEELKKQVASRKEMQINRNIYTKHIFDTVGSIRKQQEEINKIAAENLKLQKEIKSAAGKLERSFDVVEDRLYNDVENDTTLRKAYKILVKIHSEFSWVYIGIDTSGQLEREIEELNDQIALQQQKKTDEKLENIVNDWLEVKKENTDLKKLLINS